MKERLYHPTVLRALMQRHEFAARRSFGQNFLIDKNALEDIVAAAGDPAECAAVVEIGPGVGTLTQALAEAGFPRVIAIEKDPRLLPVLEETLADYEPVRVVQGDALALDFRFLLEHGDPGIPKGRHLRLVANLPYYITTPLIMKALESDVVFERFVVMVQKEVALRMIASPGTPDYGALSLAVQYYAWAKVVRTVTPGCFFPQPTVDSAVVLLRTKPVAERPWHDASEYFRIVRGAFGRRRKTLVNALAAEFSELAKPTIGEWLKAAGIDPARRGETLAAEDFAALARMRRSLEIHPQV